MHDSSAWTQTPSNPHSSLSDDLRFICLYGVPYYIPWEHLPVGGSFFLKTTAHAAMVQREVRRVERKLGMKLRAVNRVEFGFYGVRVWRL